MCYSSNITLLIHSNIVIETNIFYHILLYGMIALNFMEQYENQHLLSYNSCGIMI